MASDVEIANLALAHLGDDATVASLNPPEGSAQAEHCARFYPHARDVLLEMHDWNFATVRVQPALVADAVTGTWLYGYEGPSDAVRLLAVLAPNGQDDQPQDFVVETDATGRDLILTNQADAVLRYTRYVTDTAKFSVLFVDVLSLLLASYLAGPVIKGSEGRAESERLKKEASAMLAAASTSDANQRHFHPTHTASWIGAR